MITDAIQKLVDRIRSDRRGSRSAMEDLMSGQATRRADRGVSDGASNERRNGGRTGCLCARHAGKGRTVLGRRERRPFWIPAAPAAIDPEPSISRRPLRFVAAGAGVRVAKHGNRSATSLCGSADVMEALGIDIQMPIGSAAQGSHGRRHRISLCATVSHVR